MRIDIITLFPEFFASYFEYSILKRAQENGKAEIKIHNLRDYSTNKKVLTTTNLVEEQEW